MIRLGRWATLFALAVTPVFAAAFRIEAERLEHTGGFRIRSEMEGTSFVDAGPLGKVPPVVGAVALPHGGEWFLWVRSRKLPNEAPGAREFSVRLGQNTAPRPFGQQPVAERRGWSWESGGRFQLPGGPLLVVIGASNAAFAQCDALVLTDEASFRPSDGPNGVESAAMVPLQPGAASTGELKPRPLADSSVRNSTVSIDNGLLRLSFRGTREGMVQRVEVRTPQGWRELPGTSDVESYRVVYREPDNPPGINTSGVQFPSWDLSLSPEAELAAGGASIKTHPGPATAPWLAGRSFALRPIAARAIDKRTVELDFAALSLGLLHATWRLSDSEPSASVTLRFELAVPGYVSLGYHAATVSSREDVDFLLLPYLYHGRRFPERPVLLLNSQTPAPLTLVQRDGCSFALAAEPRDIPFEWYTTTNSRYGFGIRNEDGAVQPLLYAPVLGLPGSLHQVAGEVTSRFRMWAQAGDWTGTYKALVTNVFGLKDYRRPVDGSLSDAALALFDLLKNDAANGWDQRAKGPWNIESRNSVTQASPLTYLSYYLLTGDESFYRKYALPSLEYLISRNGAHFAAADGAGNLARAGQPLGGPVRSYGAGVYAGAYQMTQGRAPVFGQFCRRADGSAYSRPGSHPDSFDDAVELYRMTGEKRWLDQAVAEGDRYLSEHFSRLPGKDLGDVPFVNVTFVPNWEGLLHLYEATGLSRFLDAARQGAYWLLTSLWVQPGIPSGDITIHPNGELDNRRLIWWKGDRRFRLGVYDAPAPPGDRMPVRPSTQVPRRTVPAWEVSNVGLGLEQPITYTGEKNASNIAMSVWAPNLLRLFGLTGDTLFRTAARNATIGRFANYPGYYIDAHTDRYQSPDYPVTGPDVTTIYYHHIPAFAAYVLDYLFTDAEVRSRGAIRFPWVRGDGYVWFDSRLRGHAPGTIYGEPAWPWLHRSAATVDNRNVDRVLAEAGGRFYVVLMNQVPEPQTARVSFDASVLGRGLSGAGVRTWNENKPGPFLALDRASVEVRLNPLGIAVLALDGVHIDVPTHRAAPAGHLSLPKESALEQQRIEGSGLTAIGTQIRVAPFTSRDLYVYVAANREQCSGATLAYRTGDGPEQRVAVGQFPCEFSVRLPDLDGPVTWRVESVIPASAGSAVP